MCMYMFAHIHTRVVLHIFGVLHNNFHMSNDGLNHSLTVNNNQKWNDKTGPSFCMTTKHKRTKSIID